MTDQKRTYIDAEKEQLDKFFALDLEGEFQMINLLKFKDLVPETQVSGKAQYKNYMKAAGSFIQKANAKLVYMGNPIASLIGPDQLEWDKLIIITYPHKAAFIDMTTDKDYPSDMRRMALADSRLILSQ